MSCPIARKRRLQEESEQNHSPSKRKCHPLKLALDGRFNAESDGSSEEMEVKEEDEEEQSESHQQYGNEEHPEEEEKEPRSSSTNEGETEECMIIEASCTKKAKSEESDLSNYEHIVANSLLHLSSHNNYTTSLQQQQQQQQYSVAMEVKGDSSTRTEEEENNEGNKDGKKDESQTTAQTPTMNRTNEKAEDEIVKEEQNGRQEESDHQYFTEEISKHFSENDNNPHVEKTCREEYDKEENVKDHKLEQYYFSDPSGNDATQGSQKEDYITHKPLSPQSCLSNPMIIEVRSEESEKDDENEDEDDEQSMMADESEMYDMMRGNLRLLEQAIALKAQQVKGNREFMPISEHHRYFPLDDRPTKHMDLLRKSYFCKGT
ncbi:myelin transcription factor 1 isoform X1 [Tachysurus ichikawai]